MPMTRKAKRVVVTGTALGMLAVVGAVTVRLASEHVVFTQACTATASGTTVRVSLEQAENAATIAAVATRRDLPSRATTIALATALQESRLRNLDYGDRDSLGLFQQRPSQGWGTPAQVTDPVYAAGKFFDALVKLDDYRKMDIGDAAQEVQRSGFPDAYDKHEPRARVLSSSLMGNSPGSFSCALRTSGLPDEEASSNGRTPRTEKALRELQSAFGATEVVVVPTTAAGPQSVRVRFAAEPAGSTRVGWAGAQWLVAKARTLAVKEVRFDGQKWAVGRSVKGWQRDTRSDVAQSELIMAAGYVDFEVR
ncbi:MAG: hypothetical protein ACT4QG_06255 [Sporichthyaceae bacterium]